MLVSGFLRSSRHMYVSRTKVCQIMFPGSQRLFSNDRFFMNQVKVKPTTGIVGIPVQARWREMLLKLCDDVFTQLKQIPENTFYRIVTENNFKFFQRVIRENTDYEVVEDILNRGQVEELIIQFEDELQLIPMMAQWKPWEVTEEDAATMKDDIEHNEDFILADDYVPPKMKFLSWNGIYQVEYSQEELDKIEQEKRIAAERASQVQQPEGAKK